MHEFQKNNGSRNKYITVNRERRDEIETQRHMREIIIQKCARLQIQEFADKTIPRKRKREICTYNII